MYYPYLRGKQNELIALRDLLSEGLLSETITPIIEPTQASSTLRLALSAFADAKRHLAVIQNPKATVYQPFDDPEIQKIKNQEFFIPAVLLGDADDTSLIKEFTNRKIMVIIPEKVKQQPDLKLLHGQQINVIHPASSLYSRYRGEGKVRLTDGFNKLPRNADYVNGSDEFFSADHLYYQTDGLTGFSDYSTIGADFIDSGFAARAVAIHIVYFNDNDELYVKHFVSDSNEDISDPAGKFSEALKHLVDWYQSPEFDHSKNNSSALKKFEQMYKSGVYSGLGILKRLSLEHHLEIMGRYLQNHHSR